MWFWSKRNVLLLERQAAKALKCPPGFLKIPPTPKCLTYPGGYYRSYNIQYHQPSTYSNKYLRCFIHGLWPDAFPGLHLASTLRIPSAGDEGLVLGMKGNETDGPTEKYDKETENARGWKLCNNCCSFQSPFPLNPRFSVLQNEYSWLYTTMMEGLLEASGRNRGPAKSWWDLALIITDAMRLWAFIGWLIYVDMWHSIPEIPNQIAICQYVNNNSHKRMKSPPFFCTHSPFVVHFTRLNSIQRGIDSAVRAGSSGPFRNSQHGVPRARCFFGRRWGKLLREWMENSCFCCFKMCQIYSNLCFLLSTPHFLLVNPGDSHCPMTVQWDSTTNQKK